MVSTSNVNLILKKATQIIVPASLIYSSATEDDAAKSGFQRRLAMQS